MPDVIALTVDAGTKEKLTTQYRVPRDIANVLNGRIYKGDYKPQATCPVRLQGFCFVHTPEPRKYRKGSVEHYINAAEIERCIELASESIRSGIKSIMIITPVRTLIDASDEPTMMLMMCASSLQMITSCMFSQYKKQQQKMELRFKREGLEEFVSCQGQEADVVILSLVRKPTKFLNKNRLNVALSRTRKSYTLLQTRTLSEQRVGIHPGSAH